MCRLSRGTVGLGSVLAAAHRPQGPGSGTCGADLLPAACSLSPVAADLLMSQDFGDLEDSHGVLPRQPGTLATLQPAPQQITSAFVCMVCWHDYAENSGKMLDVHEDGLKPSPHLQSYLGTCWVPMIISVSFQHYTPL
ncbi:hypothetical protein HJG60_011564 [Phyllostomus discolor]|uniref:Uncharacterized protein n=1 Tax=Phyllostomus discolor TaxID=89673 RepID=A0A833ZVI0_9CHIR|nr:hypothetical protein HJG60_011564 [Phyllostomus discolor]